MVYKVIGLMSGSSLDGLDIAFVEFHENAGKWNRELIRSKCVPYDKEWADRLRNATSLSAGEYLLLDAAYGRYLGERVNEFIEEHNLHYQVQLIGSHGHTSFHDPGNRMTAQLGCGATLAAVTGINVVSDLRAMDVALGGQGAPIVPVGEKLLFTDYRFFLNLGGIANISFNDPDRYIAFDVCPANRVLNMLVQDADSGKHMDSGGELAEKGEVIDGLLDQLNALEYYRMPYPKSLSNDFGTDVVAPMASTLNYDLDDALRTYVEHICVQVDAAVRKLKKTSSVREDQVKMMVTGGGARNSFLVSRLTAMLAEQHVTVEIPNEDLIDFKEAIIMALIAVLRWREENNALASVTGASRDSIGGAVWIGQEA